MGRASRQKGQRGEREVRDIFRKHGFDCHRDGSESGDLKGDLPPGYHPEVKRAERLNIPGWTRQAEGEAGEGEVALLFYRSGRQPWRVSLDADHFIGLLAKGVGGEGL
jgi:hypothetical protein